MQSLHGNCLIAYARHKYILTMVNGEYRYFNGGDLVFADASQIRVDKCGEIFVFVSRDTLSLFLPMLKEEALNPLLLNVLQPNMRTRVCTVINNNIAHEWTLARIASELLMSPSLLKKKLREEETSYSQLLTECRMQRALQLIVIHGFSIKRVAVSCGYHSVSYFIYVFRNYYGMTPTEYQERSAQRLSNRDSAASIVAQGNFYGTDRSAEGIRL